MLHPSKYRYCTTRKPGNHIRSNRCTFFGDPALRPSRVWWMPIGISPVNPGLLSTCGIVLRSFGLRLGSDDVAMSRYRENAYIRTPGPLILTYILHTPVAAILKCPGNVYSVLRTVLTVLRWVHIPSAFGDALRARS